MKQETFGADVCRQFLAENFRELRFFKQTKNGLQEDLQGNWPQQLLNPFDQTIGLPNTSDPAVFGIDD